MNQSKGKNKSAGKKGQPNKNNNNEKNKENTNNSAIASATPAAATTNTSAVKSAPMKKKNSSPSTPPAQNTPSSIPCTLSTNTTSSSPPKPPTYQFPTNHAVPASPPCSLSSPPPVHPDPVFVLRGASCQISCLQFLSPALRLNELTATQCEVLNASYYNPDLHDADLAAGSASAAAAAASAATNTNLLKLPPPGFLSPTTHIAAGLQNGCIIIWDLKSKQQSVCWQAHSHGMVVSIKSLSPTSLVSLGRQESLKLWYINLSTQASSRKSDSEEGKSNNTETTTTCVPVCKMEIPLGDYLGFAGCDVFRQARCIVAAVPGSSQDSVSVWSVHDGIQICQLQVNAMSKVGSVMQLKWVERRNRVALMVAYESGSLCLWDWTNTGLHATACIQGTPMSLEYDQCLGSGIVGTTQDSFFIFSVSNALELAIMKEIIVTNEGLGCCISRPDSKIYVTGGWDNRIRLFSWQKHKPLAVLNFHMESVSCLHYSASRVVNCDGVETGAGPISAGTEHLLAAGSLDGSVSLWKVY